MKTTVYMDELIRSFSEKELAEAKELTKKAMNLNKILALLLFCAFGIGVILPFGKRAQLLSMGYSQLCGRAVKRGTGWAMLGFLMSWLIVTLGERISPNMMTAKIVLPESRR